MSWRVEMPDIDKAVALPRRLRQRRPSVAIPRRRITEITIIARGTVETHDKAGFVRGLTEVAPTRVFKRETAKPRPTTPSASCDAADVKAPDPSTGCTR